MKILKLILFTAGILFFIAPAELRAQKDDKFFYRDTLFDFFGYKIHVTKSLATDQYFKSTIIINNPTDQFVIFEPAEVFGFITGSANPYACVTTKQCVVPPKYSGKFNVKFVGADFRETSLAMDFKKVQLTEKIESIYEFNDVDITKENYRSVGPIEWSLLKVDSKKSGNYMGMYGTPVSDKANYRITAQLSYSGTKFLGIFYNNIILTTKDGGKYINAGKTTGKFHFDRSKPAEKHALVFPVEADKIRPENEPRISFQDVFKEYSLATIAGFSVVLVRGTEADFKGRPGKEGSSEKDIDEME